MTSEFIHNIPAAWWCGAFGVLLCSIAQAKIESDLRSRDALPEAKWWQKRSLSRLANVVSTHRELFPASAWRSVFGLGIGIFFLGFFWIFLSSNPGLRHTPSSLVNDR
jgi:hypothetical protein